MKEKVLDIIKGIKPTVELTDEHLVSNGLLTSLDILQIIATIDDELDIVIPPTKIKPEFFDSVDGIVNMLEELEND